MVTALSFAAICLLPSGAIRIQRKVDTQGLLQSVQGATFTPHGVWKPKMYRGKLNVPRPAFLLYDEEQDDVVISQFGKTSQWFPLPAKSMISKISGKDLAANFEVGRLDVFKVDIEPVVKSQILWPNKVSKHGDLFVIPDGFLAPGKSDGHIYLANAGGTAGDVLHPITAPKKGAFYHKVEWHDFDGDGLEDILTARAIVSGIIPQFRGELLWLKNPGPDRMLVEEWEEHIIADGPGTIFSVMPHSGGLAVFCAEFFRERLTVYFVSSSGELTSERILDTSIGKVFGVDLVDLDGDGHEELLVTNHETKSKDSGVFAYELPPKGAYGARDLEGGEFKKHVLATGFRTKFTIMPGAGSPGFAHAFYPQTNTRSTEAKYIVVAGDGSHDVWLLTPRRNERFAYDSSVVAQIGGTTGELLVHDFTGDGIVDVLVPDNDNFNIQAFTFQLEADEN